MKLGKFGLLAFIILGVLNGCANGVNANRGADALPGTIWVLDKLGDADVSPEITIRFDEEQISGNASCNSYFAEYALKGDQLTLGPVGSTLMMCENMDYETPYLNALAEVEALRFDGDHLVLLDAGGQDALVFSPMKHANLEEETWALTGWNTGSGISSLILDSEISLDFEDGQASGSAGCNHYFGSYKVKANMLSFGVIASTEMACLEPEGLMEQETGYLKALGQVARFSIEGSNLVMQDADGNPMLLFTVRE